MTFDRIMVWKYDEAPANFKPKNQGPPNPAWLAFIPASIYGNDLGDAIQKQMGDARLSKYCNGAGDYVYTGSDPIETFLSIVASSGRGEIKRSSTTAS